MVNLSVVSTKCVFDSTFVKLILDRIDFIGIDLIRIDFEIKMIYIW